MAKKSMVKTVKGKRVTHLGKKWTVIDRNYDQARAQSFYLLGTGSGRAYQAKWVRSDAFAV
jgi:hypothetical protein